MNFSGVIPILITPFQEDGSVDYNSIKKIINFMNTLPLSGITLLGVLGESARLSDIEKRKIIDFVSTLDNSLPVIYGVNSYSPYVSEELANYAQDKHASAVMLSPMKENSVMTDKKILNFYEHVAKDLHIPMILQDHPASTGITMSSELISEISHAVEKIHCIKEESVPTFNKIINIKKLTNNKVKVLTGLGALYGWFDLMSQSDGFNTGFAFPEILLAMHKSVKNEQFEEAFNIYQKYLPLIVFEQLPGTGYRKEIFKQRQLIDSNFVRIPGEVCNDKSKEIIHNLIGRLFGNKNITKKIEV